MTKFEVIPVSEDELEAAEGAVQLILNPGPIYLPQKIRCAFRGIPNVLRTAEQVQEMVKAPSLLQVRHILATLVRDGFLTRVINVKTRKTSYYLKF